MAKEKQTTIDVTQHILVPKHIKVSEDEKQEIFKRYNVTLKELPKISKDDPAIRNLEVKHGDMIKIIRPSRTAKEAIFYRVVVDE